MEGEKDSLERSLEDCVWVYSINVWGGGGGGGGWTILGLYTCIFSICLLCMCKTLTDEVGGGGALLIRY